MNIMNIPPEDKHVFCVSQLYWNLFGQSLDVLCTQKYHMNVKFHPLVKCCCRLSLLHLYSIAAIVHPCPKDVTNGNMNIKDYLLSDQCIIKAVVFCFLMYSIYANHMLVDVYFMYHANHDVLFI
eukprot:31422_1